MQRKDVVKSLGSVLRLVGEGRTTYLQQSQEELKPESKADHAVNHHQSVTNTIEDANGHNKQDRMTVIAQLPVDKYHRFMSSSIDYQQSRRRPLFFSE